jgi:SNF2 family DNA or RNA helicase
MHRSNLSYTPKLAAALNLLARFLEAHEQAIVFSAFHDGLDCLAARLDQAAVPHLILDGRTSPARRGRLARDFKQRRVPILLAGVESMAEMHSFPQCSNAILTAYSWAWDKWEQAINRIHRINSPGPVHVWSILCEGSIDRRLDELRREKGDSQELVLDGTLFDRRESEVNLAELIATAETEFDPESETIDEARLELEWPALLDRLTTAVAK